MYPDVTLMSQCLKTILWTKQRAYFWPVNKETDDDLHLFQIGLSALIANPLKTKEENL